MTSTASTPPVLGSLPTRLKRAAYHTDPRIVAHRLLNKVLWGPDDRSGRIVEVEAYCGNVDEAAHCYRGRTSRNASMFGPAGHLYVYRSHGIHWCCNVVCGEVNQGVGVLLRALEPLTGLSAMRAARPACKRDRDLCRGPGRLCQALGVNGACDGTDLVAATHGFSIVDDGTAPPEHPVETTRVGISRATSNAWRWYIPNCAYVSRK